MSLESATETVDTRPVRQWAGYGRKRPGKPFVLYVNPELFDAEKIRAAQQPGLLIVTEGGKNNA